MNQTMPPRETSGPGAPKRRRKGWRRSRRTIALATGLMFIATPAFATVIIQNFMEAEITATAACFTKTAGDDVAASTLVTFDGTTTEAVDGANLIEEKITLQGQIGDRVIFTDVVTYTNNCAEPISVQLVGAEASGTWADISAQLWVSNVGAPADVDPNLEVAPTDDWQDDNITVPAGTPAGVLADTTGAVTVAPGASIQGAFVISSGTAFTGTATLNWIAQATIQ